MSGLFKKIFSGAAVALIMSATVATDANATPIDQYATSVIGFSSEYTQAGGTRWNASQALGAPNVPTYSDSSNAWATYFPTTAVPEFLSLGYTAAVYATGATITESFGGGFVTQVDVIDTLGSLHTVWTGIDPSVAGVINNLTVTWAQTGYLVQGLKITINNQAANWKEIDAVMLSGQTQTIAVPSPATLALLGFGIIGLTAARRRKMI